MKPGTGSSDKLFSSGIEHIANGYAAVVILAGGQGTRLGYLGPKGEVDQYHAIIQKLVPAAS